MSFFANSRHNHGVTKYKLLPYIRRNNFHKRREIIAMNTLKISHSPFNGYIEKIPTNNNSFLIVWNNFVCWHFIQFCILIYTVLFSVRSVAVPLSSGDLIFLWKILTYCEPDNYIMHLILPSQMHSLINEYISKILLKSENLADLERFF